MVFIIRPPNTSQISAANKVRSGTDIHTGTTRPSSRLPTYSNIPLRPRSTSASRLPDSQSHVRLSMPSGEIGVKPPSFRTSKLRPPKISSKFKSVPAQNVFGDMTIDSEKEFDEVVERYDKKRQKEGNTSILANGNEPPVKKQSPFSSLQNVDDDYFAEELIKMKKKMGLAKKTPPVASAQSADKTNAEQKSIHERNENQLSKILEDSIIEMNAYGPQADQFVKPVNKPVLTMKGTPVQEQSPISAEELIKIQKQISLMGKETPRQEFEKSEKKIGLTSRTPLMAQDHFAGQPNVEQKSIHVRNENQLSKRLEDSIIEMNAYGPQANQIVVAPKKSSLEIKRKPVKKDEANNSFAEEIQQLRDKYRLPDKPTAYAQQANQITESPKRSMRKRTPIKKQSPNDVSQLQVRKNLRLTNETILAKNIENSIIEMNNFGGDAELNSVDADLSAPPVDQSMNAQNSKKLIETTLQLNDIQKTSLIEDSPLLNEFLAGQLQQLRIKYGLQNANPIVETPKRSMRKRTPTKKLSPESEHDAFFEEQLRAVRKKLRLPDETQSNQKAKVEATNNLNENMLKLSDFLETSFEEEEQKAAEATAREWMDSDRIQQTTGLKTSFEEEERKAAEATARERMDSDRNKTQENTQQKITDLEASLETEKRRAAGAEGFEIMASDRTPHNSTELLQDLVLHVDDTIVDER